MEPPVICEGCHRHIIEECVIIKLCFWKHKPAQAHIFCLSCKDKKDHTGGQVAKEALVYVTNKRPLNCILDLDFFNVPYMAEGKISNFEAAFLESDITQNKTIFADRESIEGAKIGEDNFILCDEAPLMLSGTGRQKKEQLIALINSYKELLEKPIIELEEAAKKMIELEDGERDNKA